MRDDKMKWSDRGGLGSSRRPGVKGGGDTDSNTGQ